MNTFKVLPAKPDLQQLVRSENPRQPVSVAGKPGLWQEELTETHMEIFKLFNDDHRDKIVEMAKREGQVYLETLKYGPHRLWGYLIVSPDAIATFIPLKNADGADASSDKVWNRIGRQEPERIVWQIESPFRIPASSILYIGDRNVRFLMQEYRFKSQPAVGGDREETQAARDGDEEDTQSAVHGVAKIQPAVDVAKAGEAQLNTCEAPGTVVHG